VQHRTTDILISGGGIAGLTATCAFAQAGYDVICVDPKPPIVNNANPKADLRSTAFLQPARNTLRTAGLWDQLAPFAMPLQTMRLADAGGTMNEIRAVADFNASEISNEPFAWNLSNWLLSRELVNRIAELPNAMLITGEITGRITTRTDQTLVTVGDQPYRCRLLIGADGRNSTTRAAMGIGVKTWRYGQKALAFAVSHKQPHENVSTEIHRTGGPFTTVPLPDQDGKHMSSIIWMETSANASALHALDETEFNTALNARSCGVLGEMTLATRRNLWPIIAQKAERLHAQRFALIAEAAHVIPPIGAQGLNMSLADLHALLTLCETHELGSDEHLVAYEKARKGDIDLRIRGVDALNRAAMAQSKNLRDLRLKGLKALHGLAPLRTSIMKKGLGA
jgi:2-octaprenyl-6-methoxyphenol hydroxylase